MEEYGLTILFDDIRSKEGAVNIDLGKCLRTIYKGLLMTKCKGKIEILCTSSEYYRAIHPELEYIFLSEGFDAGLKAYRKAKYEKMIKRFAGDERTRKIFEDKLKSLK